MFNRFLTAEYLRKRLIKRAPEGILKNYLSQPFVAPNKNIDEVDFLAIDLEATGLDFDRDEILSVGFTVISNMNILLSESRHFLVRPEQDIPEETAIVHGIMDDASSKGIELEQAIEIILKTLSGKVLLAHHTNVECKFLNKACRKIYGCNVVFPIVDTYAIEYSSLKHRGITPENKGLRLYNLRDDYGLPRYPAHNALSDAVAAAELFLAQIAYRQGSSVMKLKEVLARC